MFTKVLLISLCVCAAVMAQDAEQRSRVSDAQLNMALNDPRYLKRQIKCALGEAACDPVGRRLKNLAPLVLKDSCPPCSRAETLQIKRVLSHIQRQYPTEWGAVIKKFAGV